MSCMAAHLSDRRQRGWWYDINAIFDAGLSEHALVVRFYLARCVDGQGQCFPSIRTIAKKCSISRSTVIRALRELVDTGWLARESRYTDRKGQTTTLYTLLVPESTDTPKSSRTPSNSERSAPPVHTDIPPSSERTTPLVQTDTPPGSVRTTEGLISEGQPNRTRNQYQEATSQTTLAKQLAPALDSDHRHKDQSRPAQSLLRVVQPLMGSQLTDDELRGLWDIEHNEPSYSPKRFSEAVQRTLTQKKDGVSVINPLGYVRMTMRNLLSETEQVPVTKMPQESASACEGWANASAYRPVDPHWVDKWKKLYPDTYD